MALVLCHLFYSKLFGLFRLQVLAVFIYFTANGKTHKKNESHLSPYMNVKV